MTLRKNKGPGDQPEHVLILSSTEQQSMRIRSGPARPGLTLIELLAALALTSVMMVAMVGVLRRMTDRADALTGDAPDVVWRDRLASTLRRDLASARRYAITPQELCLVGYGGVNPHNGRPTLRPTEIIYTIVVHGDYPWLVREEVHLDQISNKNRQRRLVCRGATALALHPEQESGGGDEHAGPLPERGRLIVHGGHDGVLADIHFQP